MGCASTGRDAKLRVVQKGVTGCGAGRERPAVPGRCSFTPSLSDPGPKLRRVWAGTFDIPIPRPDQLAFYGTLGALVVVELVDWPVALAIGAAHAFFSDPPKRHDSSEAADQPE